MNNVREVLVMLFAFQAAFDASMADGKISVTDAGNLLLVVPTIGPAIADIDKCWDEYKNASDQERADLVKFFADKFQIPNASVEKKIELGVKLAIDAGAFFKA